MKKENIYPTREHWRLTASARLYEVLFFDSRENAMIKYQDLKKEWTSEEGDPTAEEAEYPFDDDEAYCAWEFDEEYFYLRLTRIPSFTDEKERLFWKITDLCRTAQEGMTDYIVTLADSETVRDPVREIQTIASALYGGYRRSAGNRGRV